MTENTDNRKMNRQIEILAPAGSYDCFRAAVCAGADAVYAGGPGSEHALMRIILQRRSCCVR